jgi:acetoin utilization deacetylase AcuC-like enzyme
MQRRRFLKSLGCAGATVLGTVLLGAPLRAALAGKIQMSRTGLIYDPIYLAHWLHPGHPESPQRLVAIMDELEQRGLLERLVRLEPATDVLEAVYRIHTRQHVENIRKQYGPSHEVALRAVGGAVAAVDAVAAGQVRNAFCAVRPPGHHARNTGREEGFCLYNNVAIAARHAQQAHGFERILIVDWDYHHGIATEESFYVDPSVLFFSTHDFHAYPGTGSPRNAGAGPGHGYNINVHLDCGVQDADILREYDGRLMPAARTFRPDFVLISAGFDSRQDDLLGCFAITDDGFRALTRRVLAIADEYCNGRVVSVLEGGYNLRGLASAVAAHVETMLGQEK